MDTLKNIVLRNLKLNKKRTIGTVIGIILSVALICAVGGMTSSFRQTLIDGEKMYDGNYHLKIENVNKSDIKTVAANRNISDINAVNEVGASSFNEGEVDKLLKVFSINETTANNLSISLGKGRYPRNKNEIVVSEYLLKDLNNKYKIGDEIKLNIGKSFINSSDEEEISDCNEYTFKIVGTINKSNNEFDFYGSYYTLITTGIDASESDLFLTFKNPRKYDETINQILETKDYEKEEKVKYDYTVNNELLRWQAFKFSDETIRTLLYIIGIVVLIIMISSIFCIRNAFAISVTEKTKMYGMLSSVGATKRQIRHMVLKEAFALGIIGITLGILSGIFADFVLVKIVNFLLGDFLMNIEFVFSISIEVVLIAVLLGMITIFFSAISSSRKASKISPIELVRSSSDVKIKNRKLRTPKIISKLFKTGGVIAYKNLKRSKKKYRTTVVSLVVSIFIFVSMSSFIDYGFKFSNTYYQSYDYNVFVGNINNDSDKLVSKILKVSNIKSATILYEPNYIADDIGSFKIDDKKYINQLDYCEIEKEDGVSCDEKALYVYALDNASFKKYTKKIGANYDDVKDKGILIDNYQYYANKQTKNERIYSYKKNDTINGTFRNKDFKIEVGKVTDERPNGLEQNYYNGGYIIVNYDSYKEYDFIPRAIMIDSDKPDEVKKAIDKLDDELSVSNYDELVKMENSLILVISIFLYGFIGVITLIGVTNIFNTITSNMELRQKEFAMLKSVGMTKKEFNRMVNLETLFYSIKALFFGIILGLLGSFGIYKAFATDIDFGFFIPYKSIAFAIIFVLLLVFVIMRFSIKKINKQNTIETIRNENI